MFIWFPGFGNPIPLFDRHSNCSWFLLTNAIKHLMSLKLAALWNHGYDDMFHSLVSVMDYPSLVNTGCPTHMLICFFPTNLD